MKNLPKTNRHQLVLWAVEPVAQPTVILTSGQQEQLTAALAELLLLSLTRWKGVEDAEQD